MTHYTTALNGYKPICGSESESDLWTKDIKLTDCKKCLELFRGGAFMHYSQMPGTIATDLPWPKLEPPGSFDTKECLIADMLLNAVKAGTDVGRCDIVKDCVSDYLAFMQACQIRREIAELERKDNPIMEINQTGMTATQATGLVSQTPRFGRYDRSPCDHDIWAKITTEGNGICRKCAIITVDMKPTPFYWHGELPEIPE